MISTNLTARAILRQKKLMISKFVSLAKAKSRNDFFFFGKDKVKIFSTFFYDKTSTQKSKKVCINNQVFCKLLYLEKMKNNLKWYLKIYKICMKQKIDFKVIHKRTLLSFLKGK